MNGLEQVITQMDFQYFGTGQHKVEAAVFFQQQGAVFLDVRAAEELETVRFPLKHHCEVLEIPASEVPVRLAEIPKDKPIGVFCSAGVRAVIIFTYLQSMGFDNVKVIPGGYAPVLEALMPGKVYKKINS